MLRLPWRKRYVLPERLPPRDPPAGRRYAHCPDCTYLVPALPDGSVLPHLTAGESCPSS
jgi:hypothetical protein